MRNRSLSSPLSIWLLTLVLGILLTTAPALAGGETFESEVGKFSLVVPMAWKAEPYAEPGVLVRLTGPGAADRAPNITVSMELSRSNALGELRVREAMERGQLRLAEQYPGIQMDNPELITMKDGEKAYRVSGSLVKGGGKLYVVRIGRQRLDTTYLITYTAPQNDFPLYRQVFAEVLAGFKAEGMKYTLPTIYKVGIAAEIVIILLIAGLLWKKYVRGLERI